MRTIGEYIDKINDVQSIISRLNDVIDEIDNSMKDRYPFGSFEINQATIYMEEYIEMLKDTKVNR